MDITYEKVAKNEKAHGKSKKRLTRKEKSFVHNKDSVMITPYWRDELAGESSERGICTFEERGIEGTKEGLRMLAGANC